METIASVLFSNHVDVARVHCLAPDKTRAAPLWLQQFDAGFFYHLALCAGGIGASLKIECRILCCSL
jgi:hypothetical protein